ncbi:hypothetical protein GZL_09313 [Streptomyces sp. 769]|nr:hypothetical protein GZL_00100 [Streptomyces sp. 769]AJC61831.1 hypothetical protein GZL_09313 [Streptomyces sp. 769]
MKALSPVAVAGQWVDFCSRCWLLARGSPWLGQERLRR